MTRLSAGAAFAMLVASAVFLSACRTAAPGASAYDPQARQQAVELKGRVLALMAVSGEPYARHSAEVEALNAEIQAAYEAAATTGRNEQVTRQWELMRDPQGDLYAGLVRRWRTAGTVSAETRDRMIPEVSRSFDYLMCLQLAMKSGGLCVAEESLGAAG